MPQTSPHDGKSLAHAAVDRRQALAAMGVGAAMMTGLAAFAQNESPISPPGAPVTPEQMGWDSKAGKYILPPLPYKPDALEPHIDAQTMQLHHDKHHQGYVNGLNTALDALAEIRSGKRQAAEVKHWSRELAFNGSGHFLHVLFWNCMTGEKTQAGSATAKQISSDFGSMEGFSNQFKAAAGAVEGSGWAILVFEPIARRLMIMQAEKHQNLTAWGVMPLLAIDVWEHAYYLKYQNRRPEYVSEFMNVINWEFVERHLAAILAHVHKA
jgi:Fe-Mn family superoxide dismutase